MGTKLLRLMRVLRELACVLALSAAVAEAYAQVPSVSANAVSGTQINLTWTPPWEGGVHGVFRGGSFLGYTWSTSYSDTGLASGTSYSYCIRMYGMDEGGGYYVMSDCGTAGATTLSAPSAPSGLGASAVSGTQINLSWTDTSSNETGFKVERKTGSGGTYAQIATPSANATSYSDTGLSSGTQYYYRVRATNSVGDSSYASEVNATTISPPSAPSGLGGTPASSTQINLSWTDNASNETGFKLERKTGSGGTYSQIATPSANATSYSDTGVSSGNTYFYRLRATNSGGDSSYSNEVSVSFTVPAAPTGLAAIDLPVGSIRLVWTDNSDSETGFKVERKTGAGGTYSQIATPAANATSYDDSGLTPGVIYVYRMRAAGIAGDSSYTSEVSIMATAPNVTNGTVTYTYDVWGNLKTTNAGGVTTTLTYDLRGRKTQMVDPDMGTWTYDYNALGELIRQTDAKSQVTTMEYDLLGRMTKRTEADLVSRWSFDAYPSTSTDPNWSSGLLTGLSGSCAKGVGKLCFASSDNDYKRLVTYDSLGRPQELKVSVDTTYTTSTTYDSSGRADVLTYPTGFAVKHIYNSYGHLQKVQSTDSTPVVFWQASTKNAAGQVTGESLGNGLTVSRTYDALFRLTAVSATDGSATPHSQTFAYDPIGNLTQRVDVHQSVTENFAFDTLNRLITSSGPGLPTRAFDYDAIGNISYRSSVGAYTYGTKPHAVSSVSGNGEPYSLTATYTYDANGSLTASSGNIYPASGSVAFSRTLTYTSFNMPATLSQTQGGVSHSYTYTYNAEHERVKLVTVRPSDTLTSIYLHPAGKGALLYEKETRASDSLVEHKHYVTGGSGLIGVYVTKSTYGSGEGPEMRYYHKDHLGSIAVITNPAGAVIERLSYEAFGERKYPNGTAQDRTSPIVGVSTDRGFTGHEHLDEMMLVHMNGRIYDPILARFMTADPFVDSASNLQSFNRYSYVSNNPLAYTDPSGYFKLGAIFARIIAAVADAYGCAGYCSAAVGAYQGAQNGGGLGGAITGAVAGYVSYNFPLVGSTGINWSNVVIVASANALAGCVSADSAGGDCGRGALAGATGTVGSAYGTSVFGPLVGAIIGGCAGARIGGGKCSQGVLNAVGSYAVGSAIGYIIQAQRTDTNNAGEDGNRFFSSDYDPNDGATAGLIFASDEGGPRLGPPFITRGELSRFGASLSKWLERSWEKSTFGTWRDSLVHHYNKHIVERGKDMNVVQYTRAAQANWGNQQAIKTPTVDGLGRPAIEVRSAEGWGVYTPRGKIITFEPSGGSI